MMRFCSICYKRRLMVQLLTTFLLLREEETRFRFVVKEIKQHLTWAKVCLLTNTWSGKVPRLWLHPGPQPPMPSR